MSIGEPVGADSLRQRSEVYREVVNALEKMYTQQASGPGARILLQASIKHQDPLLREAVYEWLLVKGLMQKEVLQNADPAPEGLEQFLQKLHSQRRGKQSSFYYLHVT
jgi:hypothetical protein